MLREELAGEPPAGGERRALRAGMPQTPSANGRRQGRQRARVGSCRPGREEPPGGGGGSGGGGCWVGERRKKTLNLG
jgi:hypothetical protein